MIFLLFTNGDNVQALVACQAYGFVIAFCLMSVLSNESFDIFLFKFISSLMKRVKSLPVANKLWKAFSL